MSVAAIKKAMWRSITEEEWPPTPAKFRKLGEEDDFDYDESFDRFINRGELSDPEWFAAKAVGYECRTRLSEDKARRKWAKSVKQYREQQQAGMLPERGQKRVERTKAGRDWVGPDGELYTCWAEYKAKEQGLTWK